MKHFFFRVVLPIMILMTACTQSATPTATQTPITATPSFTATLTETPEPSETSTNTAIPDVSSTPSAACGVSTSPYSLIVDVSARITGAETRLVTVYTSDTAVWLISEGKSKPVCYLASLTPVDSQAHGKYYLVLEVPAETKVLKLIRPTLEPVVYGGDWFDPGKQYDYINILLFPSTPTPTATVLTSTNTPTNTPTFTPTITSTPTRTPTPTVTFTVTPVVLVP